MLKLVIHANHMSSVLQTAVSSVGDGHLGKCSFNLAQSAFAVLM